jgi:hypothetical protein
MSTAYEAQLHSQARLARRRVIIADAFKMLEDERDPELVTGSSRETISSGACARFD